MNHVRTHVVREWFPVTIMRLTELTMRQMSRIEEEHWFAQYLWETLGAFY